MAEGDGIDDVAEGCEFARDPEDEDWVREAHAHHSHCDGEDDKIVAEEEIDPQYKNALERVPHKHVHVRAYNESGKALYIRSFQVRGVWLFNQFVCFCRLVSLFVYLFRFVSICFCVFVCMFVCFFFF
jgi:hypothetical protein